MIPPRVVVDERERSCGVPEQLSKLNVRVYFSRLPIADYVISPEIAVERKALPDFVSSVYDGRLFVQAASAGAQAAAWRRFAVPISSMPVTCKWLFGRDHTSAGA